MKKRYTFQMTAIFNQITVKAENETEAREKVIKNYILKLLYDKNFN